MPREEKTHLNLHVPKELKADLEELTRSIGARSVSEIAAKCLRHGLKRAVRDLKAGKATNTVLGPLYLRAAPSSPSSEGAA